MKPCPECNSENVYKYSKPISAMGGYGPDLLPDLKSSFFSSAEFLPVLCSDCGLVRFFASKDARERVKESARWNHV